MISAKQEQLKRWLPFIIVSGLFLVLCVFFIKVHPLVLFDQDDWDYISNYRRPFPLWGAWNPTRVLPENLMPLAGYAAAYLVKPLVGDYILAVTWTSAILVALGICLYYLVFKKYVSTVWHLNCSQVLLVSLFFILAHFGLFRSLNENNSYLFLAADLTCYYFYTLPSLLNAGLVLFMMTVQDFPTYFAKGSNLQKGGLILIIYLALCSNLFSSCILGIYGVVQIGRSVLVNRQKPGKFYTILVGLWMLILLFEANGKDAARVGGAYSYLHLPLHKSFKALLLLARQIDWSYVGLTVICLAGALWVYRRIKKSGESEGAYKPLMLETASCLGLMFVFLILLCAKVTPGYASRPEAAFGLYFYGLLLVFNGGSYLLQNTALANKLLPVVLWIFVVIGTNPSSPFRESNHRGQPPYECMAVSRSLLAQAQSADVSGQHEFVLKVPKGSPKSNWPHPPAFLGDILTRTLSAHGLVNHKLKIKVQVEPKMNQEFYK